MEWIRKAPTALAVAVTVVCGVLALAVLAAYVYLTAQGIDTTEFRQWVNTVGQLLLLPVAGTAAVAATSAARSSSRAEDQTNGQLTARDAEIERLRDQVRRLGGMP
jgi:hypothetical protein